MELIRISETKLKIMLTSSDMTQYEIPAECTDTDTEQMRRAFRQLMKDVRRKTGMEMDERHLSVRYFPAKGGGCEMFVCSLEKPDSALCALPIPHPVPADIPVFVRDCSYRFRTLKALLDACRRLVQVGYIGESRAVTDEHGNYHLLLKIRTAVPFTLPEALRFLSEYATPENSKSIRLYLCEHGTPLCEANAVETLAPFA